MDKVVNVRDRYSRELSEINYIFQNLEIGRYYENSQAKMDGSLAHNISKLRKEFDGLIEKIEYNDDSRNEEIKKALEKIRD